MQLRVLTPGEDGPRFQNRVEKLHWRHMEMSGIAPREEVQGTRIGRTWIDQSRTHGQPDGRRGELLTVRLWILQVGGRRPAKVRGLNRVSYSVLTGCYANTDGENAGRTGRSPVLIGPRAGSHLRKDEKGRDASFVKGCLESCVGQRHGHAATHRLHRFGDSIHAGQPVSHCRLLPGSGEVRPRGPVIHYLQTGLSSA